MKSVKQKQFKSCFHRYTVNERIQSSVKLACGRGTIAQPYNLLL